GYHNSLASFLLRRVLYVPRCGAALNIASKHARPRPEVRHETAGAVAPVGVGGTQHVAAVELLAPAIGGEHAEGVRVLLIHELGEALAHAGAPGARNHPLAA